MNLTKRMEQIEGYIECQESGHDWHPEEDRFTEYKTYCGIGTGISHTSKVPFFFCSRCGASRPPSLKAYRKYIKGIEAIKEDLK